MFEFLINPICAWFGVGAIELLLIIIIILLIFKD